MDRRRGAGHAGQNAALGAALAKKLGNNPVVLMRGHGMTVVADSVKRATVQAVYTQIDAQVQLAAMQLNKNIVSMDAKELAYNHVENFDVDRPWDNFKNKLPKETADTLNKALGLRICNGSSA